MNLRSTITTSALAIAGFALWSYAGNQLKNGGSFDYHPNPMGLKMSPYGQVIAMAIQTPIDADWHGAIEVHDLPVDDEPEHQHHEGCEHDQDDALAAHDEHDAGCSDPDCGHDHSAPAKSNQSLIERLDRIATKRTNPYPATEGHKFYLRLQIEKKMRFAYELDPSHYANYNSYNLFLTQLSLGTEGGSQAEVHKRVFDLAENTIRYCLREQNDPRPALTASSAAYNILERMILSADDYTTSKMREKLAVMDFCLRQHFHLLEQFDNDGSWKLLSERRQAAVLDRSRFALKLRESAETAIIRIESEQMNSSTANHEPS